MPVGDFFNFSISTYFLGLTITNVSSSQSDDQQLTITKFDVRNKNDGKSGTVTHHHWQSWNDTDVPPLISTVFDLLSIASANIDNPTIVHCSAGIGRTGTLVAIEMCLRRLYAGKELDVVRIVHHLRGNYIYFFFIVVMSTVLQVNACMPSKPICNMCSFTLRC